ncbi:hypothetical protein [Nocardia sp. NPDC051463]|uniref:hypothetical protein n=1 Tax=Nocardia sp. NPDC051463 TaxID=3154845 RepID=UPI0034216B02
MPARVIPSTSSHYYLLLFDENGAERPEADGSLLSNTIAEVAGDGVTDVFIASHGWKGDIPAAISQYNDWIPMMQGRSRDLARAQALVPDFKPLTIGIHWPSLPWGVEAVGAALLSSEGDEFAAERELDSAGLVDLYSQRIADTEVARRALTVVVSAADDAGDYDVPTDSIDLSAEVDEAYQALFGEAGLQSAGATAAPGSDQEGFSPVETAKEWAVAVGPEPVSGGVGKPGLLGGGSRVKAREIILAPARQLSFWSMKHRARVVGESGVHELLIRLQQSARPLRIHLMGHSFGCIVVSAAIAGPVAGGTLTQRLPRPVSSLFLVQGAMSLWSFAEVLPFPPTLPGYFRPVLDSNRLVAGPVVTTTSVHDHAVGRFFPIGAKLGRERLLDGNHFPEYGAIGAFGMQGGQPTVDHGILDADAEYGLDPGTDYNIDASRIIAKIKGAVGSHSDIAHPEIAHLFWQAAVSGILADRN